MLWEPELSEGEKNRTAKHPEMDIREAMRREFSSGQGVITLQPGMTDEAILVVIKLAISVSNGKAFTVVPPPTIN